MLKIDTKTGTRQYNWYWSHKGEIVEELPKDCEAFVYLITNTMNGMMYVGKKLAKFKTTKKPLKGKKNKRRGTKESDWKTYWGSSEKLAADIEKFCPFCGHENEIEEDVISHVEDRYEDWN